MKITIDNAGHFRDMFAACGREKEFSYEALGLLFNYLEEINPDYELDVIELCEEYTEDTWGSIAEAYGIEIDENESDDEQIQQVKDFLETETVLIGETSGGFFLYVSNF
jgi:hypothetical protein